MQSDMKRRTAKSKVSKTGVLCGLLNDVVREGEFTRLWELFMSDSSYYYTVGLGE